MQDPGLPHLKLWLKLASNTTLLSADIMQFRHMRGCLRINVLHRLDINKNQILSSNNYVMLYMVLVNNMEAHGYIPE
jgi:hypothetical protein